MFREAEKRWLVPTNTFKLLKLGEGIPDGAAELHQRWENDALALCIGGHTIRRIGWSGVRAEKSSKSEARTRVATASIMIERKRRSRPRSRIAGTAIPSFSLALKSPRTTCFWVSQRIGNGNSYWRRTRSDCSGESTATAAMRTPRPRKSSKWSRNSANWRRQKGHQ